MIRELGEAPVVWTRGWGEGEVLTPGWAGIRGWVVAGWIRGWGAVGVEERRGWTREWGEEGVGMITIPWAVAVEHRMAAWAWILVADLEGGWEEEEVEEEGWAAVVLVVVEEEEVRRTRSRF